MNRFTGKPLNNGIAIGRARIIDTDTPDKDNETGLSRMLLSDKKIEAHISDSRISGELERFETAKLETIKDLLELQYAVKDNSDKNASGIFEMYGLLLNDEGLTEACRDYITKGHHLAEYAVIHGFNDKASALRAVDDPVISSRADDMLELRDELLRSLLKRERDYESVRDDGRHGNSAPDEKSFPNIQTGAKSEKEIIIAEDLTASDVARLDRSVVAGIVLAKGSETSHASILMRGMNIPVMIRCRDLSSLMRAQADEADTEGMICILDADEGCLYADPDEALKNEYFDRINKKSDSSSEPGNSRPVNKKGNTVKLYANISSVSEADDALKNGADGIGLFRTEFLCFGGNFPSEDEQYNAYKELLSKMSPKPVIVRVFDIGADKVPEGLSLHDTLIGQNGRNSGVMAREDNPALGIRGIRFLLAHEEIFRTQLRALLRATACGYDNLGIMLPMVSTINELRESRRILDECLKGLNLVEDRSGKNQQGNGAGNLDSGSAQTVRFRFGIMIETPAAALMAQDLAKEADFFSIGTNDLIQYTYAADRTNGAASDYVDDELRAVLKLIEMTISAAHDNKIPAGVCGELAADRIFRDKFISMGIDSLSVSRGQRRQ